MRSKSQPQGALSFQHANIVLKTKKKSVLIVDDQPMVSQALKMFLEMDGYEVHTAENGHEAIALFQPERFALIFTDFEMPGMNGHELASIIKAQAPRQPVIMITAYADTVLDGTSLPHVDFMLGKPWTIDDIRRAIDKVLSDGSALSREFHVARTNNDS